MSDGKFDADDIPVVYYPPSGLSQATPEAPRRRIRCKMCRYECTISYSCRYHNKLYSDKSSLREKTWSTMGNLARPLLPSPTHPSSPPVSRLLNPPKCCPHPLPLLSMSRLQSSPQTSRRLLSLVSRSQGVYPNQRSRRRNGQVLSRLRLLHIPLNSPPN